MAISDQDGYDGGQALVKALENEGIEYLFGLSGGAALPIFDALVSTDNKMKFVLVRHEQGASHMADGYARATGKPAVVLVTSGPGATNTLTGIMTAHMDSCRCWWSPASRSPACLARTPSRRRTSSASPCRS